jgi:hypothetical protein
MAKIGDRVLAKWPGERIWWYPGVVCGNEDDQIELQFDDGDRAVVLQEDLSPLQFPAGTIVQARIDRDLRYIPATVLEQRGQALLLRFPNDAEMWTSICLVRVALDSPESESIDE